MGTTGLSVRNITRVFDDHVAVNDISFDVHPGELVALVGASGSGKTTSLRIVAGYESPDQGEVIFNGANITRLVPEKRGFGMVFQHYALFPHMSVLDNVGFGLEARNVPRPERYRRAEAALASVGLQGKGERRVQQLSGGEQQRVALARAVVIEPNVLLLDEPLSNLDPTLRESTRDELRAMLHRVGAPALFVTHDQEDAFAVADRVVLLAKGRVLQSGTPEDLYQRPASREVATFIGRSTLVPAADLGDRAVIRINGISHKIPINRPLQASGPASGPTSGQTSAASRDGWVVLRPEALALSDESAADAWHGQIAEARYAGATWVYRVALSADITVEVASAERLAIGTPVYVSVRRVPVPFVT